MSSLDITEVRSRIDIVDLFGRLTNQGVKVRGGSASSACPSPNHQQTGRTPPCSIDITRGLWCCHGCGAGGDAITAIAIAGGLTTGEAIRAAASLVGMPASEWPLPDPPPRTVLPDRGPIGVITKLGNANHLRAEYAASRRWTENTLEVLGVTVAAVDNTPRLIIPADAEIPELGMQGRTIVDGSGLRWWTIRRFKAPYGARLIDQTQSGEVVIIAEGASDFVTGAVLRNSNPDMPVVVTAPGATAWNADWCSFLKGRIAVLIGDPDEAGMRYVDAVARGCIDHGVAVASSTWPGDDDLSAYLARSAADLSAVAESVLNHIEAHLVDIGEPE
jgi:CHC2 zinc finger